MGARQNGPTCLRLGAKTVGLYGAGRHPFHCRPAPCLLVDPYPLPGGNPAARRIRSTTSISWRPVSGSLVWLAICAISCASSTTSIVSVIDGPSIKGRPIYLHALAFHALAWIKKAIRP